MTKTIDGTQQKQMDVQQQWTDHSFIWDVDNGTRNSGGITLEFFGKFQIQ